MPSQRAPSCGCTTATDIERWYFAIYNDNPTECVATFTVASNSNKKRVFLANSSCKNVANSSNSGSLLPFQGKYYNFALKSQILSLQLYEFCAFF